MNVLNADGNIGRSAIMGAATYAIGRQRCGFRQEEVIDVRMMIVAGTMSLLAAILMQKEENAISTVALGNLVTAFLSATDAVQLHAPRSFTEWRAGINRDVMKSACVRLVYAIAISVLLDMAREQGYISMQDSGIIVLHAIATVGVATADYDIIYSAIAGSLS